MSETRNFWSDRKRAVEAEAEAEAEAATAVADAEVAKTQDEKSDEDLLAELNLPEPESLQAGDDFSAFMSKAVPDRLRRRALRVLWRSNPVLANVDMLVDYGEDFTDASMVVENMQTAYQVGKGMMKHVEEMARQAAAKEAAETPEDDVPPEDLPDVDIAATPEAELEVEEEDVSPAPAYEFSDSDEDAPARPGKRRMRFDFDEA